MSNNESLTGVWHGRYTYTTQPYVPESDFVCVLIESGGSLSGTIHEEMKHFRKATTRENATIQGRHDAGVISFIKIYDGSGKNSHSVKYAGHVNATQDEIEGTWTIGGVFRSVTGRFLMIRKRSETLEHSEEVEVHSAKEVTPVL